MESTPGKLESTGQPDPLAQMYGKPMITIANSSQRYLGRVIVELYESEGATDDQMLAFTIDPAIESELDHEALVKRIAHAFAIRVTKPPFGG